MGMFRKEEIMSEEEKKFLDFENDRKQHMAWLASYLVKYLFV